ncbi:PTS fructose transporter subunit IIBC [Acinetobacter sp. Ac_877]|uniref:protein-N(pi)-phosphohistidine--D-fructose phosphotransferase n=1 Tax=Acinetobacter faecalis TaxID=2665161 RepID=A0A6L6GGP6_9GAMM|nr:MULTISPECIES: fructose-specific PTS transporter subunit EIIC [Acinetobacter]MDY6486163.1 fructose-specific PTS transporter subunit EIIC [Acinetobacter faecalis]MDY6488803.1 fructose-specific PTS transporter subunit EIIC [Acinetobacter faecalis]MDY6510364.1 fructose-specific PTS transporter subunit EIIC [Acinetobacter faecalis]MPW41152.1 PTS fructose transporter subunit IIBC [Acinetobacter portensis]MTD11661.1 PTS fructose transporter subunit IIBC [Acinetobacter faecalis]
MQEIKHILFVPHSPEQPINAVILSKKLSKAATALGISNHVATSVEHLDLSNVIDTVVFVGQKSAEADQLRDKVVKVIGLNNAQHDAIMLLQQVLEHSDALDETIAANEGVTRFVAITACPTGVAHTFMAAEALQQGAVKHGYQIDVETQGSVGAKNVLSVESIAKADVVILATDIEVNTDRFVGKRVYRCSTGFALKQTDKTFANAIAEAKVLETGKQTATKTENENKEKTGIYKHLLTGVSFMLPMVVAGGLIIAISFMFGLNPVEGSFAASLKQIGAAAFTLMVPMLAGYIAYSIADRPGLTPGLIGGLLATQLEAGFLGGLVAGFIAGYIALFLSKQLKLPSSLEALKPILIIPLLASLAVGLIMIYVVGQPVAQLFELLTYFLANMGTTNAMIMGVILGSMMCIDVGGPINKAAYAFTVGLLTSQTYGPMAITMAAGMVPPLGMAIATFLAKHKFAKPEQDAGKAAVVLGLCFISEGAIPFAAKDPIRVLPCAIAGGAVTGALVALFKCELVTPHGGVMVLIIPNAMNYPLKYLLAIAIGSVVTGVAYAVIKQRLE